MKRRIDGPTPNGGTYAIMTFLNVNHEPVSEAEATHFELVEYDEAGEQVFRTYAEFIKIDVEPPT